MRAFAVGQRREMAETAVARRGASIALACRAFGVSKTCYRYGPKLQAENEQIADLLVGLTDARKTLVWAVFPASLQREGPSVEPQTRLPHLLRAGTEPADQTPQAVEAGQTRCARGARSPQCHLVHGLHGGSSR